MAAKRKAVTIFTSEADGRADTEDHKGMDLFQVTRGGNAYFVWQRNPYGAILDVAKGRNDTAKNLTKQEHSTVDRVQNQISKLSEADRAALLKMLQGQQNAA